MDILSVAAIRLPCSWCGKSYEVPLRDILLSHKIMHEGCPAPVETECPPVFQSRLAPERLIKSLEQAWRRLERSAAGDGGELVLTGQNVERPSKPKNFGKRSNVVRPNPSRGRAA
jgi:hypothetical protein